MEIHNIIEELVFGSIQTIIDSFESKGNPEKLCFCEQCRADVACYVLNRCTPRYIVSNRGVARLKQDAFEWQQLEADISTLIHNGIRRIQHNQRPNAPHGTSARQDKALSLLSYNIPVIVGRIFDGSTFAPLAGVKVELRSNGELVEMKDHNWQNPYTLVSNTAGSFTFWPMPVPAETADDHKIFEYSIVIESSEYETLIHYFKIPVVSQLQSTVSFSIERTFKLPDLYMFPPGEAEQNG
jgi:competence protein ComFB